MRNQVYSRYIYQMLMEYGRAYVPDVGTFELKHKEAAFNALKNHLTPPSTSLIFSGQADEKFRLGRLLVESGMADEHAQKIENLAVADYRNSLQIHSPFVLDQLGTLTDGVFVENKSGTFNRYLGLQEIDAFPVASSTRFITHDEAYLRGLQKTYLKKEKSPFFTYFWPWLLVVSTVLIILLWILSHNAAANKSIQKSIITADSLNNSAFTDKEKTTADIEYGVEKDSVLTDSGNFEPVESVEDKDRNLLNNPSSSPTTNKIETPRNCILIVGAFKREVYADRMWKKIIAKGFQPYREEHNGLKRIGISYNCTDQDPDTFKALMRKSFSKGAWNLHDTI